MTPKNYVKTFQKIGQAVPIWNSVFLIVKEAQESGQSDLIQRAVVECGQSVGKFGVDGVIGQATIIGIARCNPVSFLTMLGVLLKQTDEPLQRSVKDTIMDYLAEAEGLHVHWNSTESNFTTMYGIYATLFPRAKPVLYILRHAKTHGIRVVRKNISKIDALLSDAQRVVLRDMIYDFYVENFMDERVNRYLEPLSALSFFSHGVNGGKKRGVITLQRALKIDDDGIVGKGTLMALEHTSMDDVALNNSMGVAMWRFYKYLASKGKKYSVYLNGWRNRLLGLNVWEKLLS